MSTDDEVSHRSKIPAPRSLDEMHDLPTADYHRVERYQWGDSASLERVLEHIIELAAAELEWRGRANANSLRDFWYNPTKPIVDRVFPDVDSPDDRLSKTLSNAVKEGRVRYRDLNILDDSRKRLLYTSSPESDRILFVEKRAAYRKLQPLAEVYELTLVSGGGQASTAMIEDLIHELRHGGGSGEPRPAKGGYHLYTLSDYDPSGFEIAQSFAERCETLGLPVASVERIGISPDDFDRDTVARQRFKPSTRDASDREWLATHGIDGQYGLEIEAIGSRTAKGEALRGFVVDTLADSIRTDTRCKRDLENARERAASRAADDTTAILVEDIRERLTAEAVDLLDEREKNRRSKIEPFDGDELHDGAVEGRAPHVRTQREQAALREILRERIDMGEIPVKDLLGGTETDE